MHQWLYLPKMGLAPISPLIGALPWATTAKGERGVVVGAVVVAAAAAIDTATAAPYIGFAACCAAINNIIQNIACIIHTKQYLYMYQYNDGWIYQPLLYWYTNVCVGVADGRVDDDGVDDDGVDDDVVDDICCCDIACWWYY